MNQRMDGNMTDRKLLEQALEALEFRCGSHADERRPNGVITALRARLKQPEQNHMEDNLALVAAPVQEPVAIASDDSGIYEFWARNKEAEKQAGLKFLADATRFKVRLTKHDCKINNLPRELGGRWVALVAAEDDSHLHLTAAQRPVAEPHKWVGLTDEEMYFAIRPLYKTDALANAAVALSKDEYRAIEAKLKAKNSP
jgi:hypothetical protein